MRAEGDYHGACDEYHGLLAGRLPRTQNLSPMSAMTISTLSLNDWVNERLQWGDKWGDRNP